MAHILIVDDDEISSVLLADYLRACGHHVVHAAGVPEASDRLRESAHVDLMILDYMMPNQSGLELLQILGRDPSMQRPPTILSSAVLQGTWWPTVQKMLPPAIQEIVQAFVDKPYTLEQMEIAIDEVLARPRRKDEPPTTLTSEGRIKILMTEDDEASGLLVLQELRARGYAAGWCRNGTSCWEAIGRPDAPLIDLLILDLKLPDMEGEDLLRKLGPRLEADHVRVIVVTAHLAHGEEKSFVNRLPPPVQTLVSAVLIKPFDLSSLNEAINRAVTEFR